MGDSLITIFAIFIAAILMFVFPLMAVSERTDDVSQLAIQTATAEFVDNIRATGKLTASDYEKFVETVSATGNSYDVEMQIQVLDENPGKKVTQVESTKIGENVYYNVYTSQILDIIAPESGTGKTYKLKEGDIFSTSVKNTNTTISQLLRNFFYQIAGNDTYQVAASYAGMVQVNGK